MEEETSFVIYEGIVVPESASLKRERKNRYGSVPGLDDEELAEPDELERRVVMDEWRPVLALPLQKKRSGITAAIDESGGVDWGAFGTVDFERTVPAFDNARYKLERLREELKDVMIMIGIVKGRMPGKAKYLVLKCLQMGIIDMEDVVDDDMLALARLDRRARRLQKEGEGIEAARIKRQEAALARWLA